MREIQRLEEDVSKFCKKSGEIKAMRKGSVIEQFLKVKHKGRQEPRSTRSLFSLYSKRKRENRRKASEKR